MRGIVLCEESEEISTAFRNRGHEMYSCDLKPARNGPSKWHFQGDCFDVLFDFGPCDIIIIHPDCTYLTNAGVRWLYKGGKRWLPDGTENAVDPVRWALMLEGVAFYKRVREAALQYARRVAIENPIFHGHAAKLLGNPDRQIVQPWMFGVPEFKATGWELHGLPSLEEGPDSLRGCLPKPGTEEHKKWSKVHRAPPGAGRQQLRSETPPGCADAYARQWGNA